jgi:hypothetical protein
MPIYVAHDNFNAFEVRWDRAVMGAHSITHRGLMRMLKGESDIFRQMERDKQKQTTSESGRWTYSIRDGA